MKTITVFTPTYNRAHLLQRGYEALCRQSSYDFEWLVVDDGSTDDTRTFINSIKEKESRFPIRYVYKQNGGLQSGYVEALKHITTELCFCVDSDDYLLDDAIQNILLFWKEKGSNKFAGILGLDCFSDGSVVGGYYPDNHEESINLIDLDLGRKYKRSQLDRMLIIRTDIYRTATPAKTYPNERTLNASYLHLQISRDYDFLILNKPLCVIEYQQDGMSATIPDQYIKQANSWADWRIFLLQFPQLPFHQKLKNNIHYVSSCIFAEKRKCIHDSPTKLLTILVYPFGVLLNLYIRKKSMNMK